MKYAEFSAEGLPTAFYSEDIHGPLMREVFGEMVLVEQEDEDGGRFLVPDLSVSPNPPLLGMEPNPDCMIPDQAIPITDEQWREFIENPGRRKWVNGAIEAFTPPLPDPGSPYRPLKPYQFWGAVRAADYEGDLHAWVAAIADPVEKGVASAMLEFSLEFRRDHPLMDQARIALNMSEQELDTLWLWGLTL